MPNKVYWIVGIFVLSLIGLTAFMLIKNQSEIQALKEDLAQTNKQVISQKKPKTAREGFKWIEHGDHYHEVPISAPDVWQGNDNSQIELQPTQSVKRPATLDNPVIEDKSVSEITTEQLLKDLRLTKRHLPNYTTGDLVIYLDVISQYRDKTVSHNKVISDKRFKLVEELRQLNKDFTDKSSGLDVKEFAQKCVEINSNISTLRTESNILLALNLKYSEVKDILREEIKQRSEVPSIF